MNVDYLQDPRDPPNPFSSSPLTRTPSPLDSLARQDEDDGLWGTHDEQEEQGRGTIRGSKAGAGGGSRGDDDEGKPLPPNPMGGTTINYPDLNLYPAAAHTSSSRGFEEDDEEEDDEVGAMNSAGVDAGGKTGRGYPDLDLYPSMTATTGKDNSNSNVRPNIYAASTTSWSNSPPHAPPQSQSQTHPNSTTSTNPTTNPNPHSNVPLPTHRPSFPSPGSGGKSYIGPKVKEEACCELDESLGGGNGVVVEIIDAVKTNDGGRASYITYVIRTGNRETHHRYSHFDSLRTSLQALYPVLIVPPIPSKQSLTDYAVKGSSKAKEDATVIARRMRTLEDFLRRVARHPILGGEHVFHRFLDGVSSWNDVLHSPPLSSLPKNPLHAPTYNPTIRPAQPFPQSPGSPSRSAATDDLAPDADDPNSATPQSPEDPTSATTNSSYIAHHLLPNVSAATPLKHPDGRFLDSEAFTDKFAHHLSSVMERVNRRVFKRWGERSHGASELGAVINGLSLDLDDGAAKELLESVGAGVRGVQEAVEKFGQAVDAEHMSTSVFLQQWERSATEPLHIYAQYGHIIRQRLSFRHQKHVQYELVQSTLEHQREKLEVLEKAERESKRLEEALESGGKSLMGAPAGSSPSNPGMGHSVLTGQSVIGGSVYRENGVVSGEEGSISGLPRTPTKKRGGAGVAGGYGLLSAVKHSLSGMMDVDPEATRRANIGRTRDNISQLEDSLQAAAQDLKYASQTLQADLDRFQRQKVADMRDMTIAMAEMHREWAKINLKAWEEAKLAIQSIEPHPNRPLKVDGPEKETETQTPGMSSGVTPSQAGDRSQREDSGSPLQQQRSFNVDRAKTEVSQMGYSSQSQTTTRREFTSPVDAGFEAVQPKGGDPERSSASDPLSAGIKDHPL